MKTLYIISSFCLYRYDNKNNELSLVTTLKTYNSHRAKEVEEFLLKERGLKPNQYKLQII